MSIRQEDIDLAIRAEQGDMSPTKKRSTANVNFKMVTFTLAGKRYGIDIMKVKEIRKAGNFTYVPNIEPHIRGVDNLRGDIIPIIDMRLMFSLPVPEMAEGELENVIVLRFGELIIGIVVDTVEKVVGIMKENIRPPHPLFGDINIKYLDGVIEENNHLYIVLNVDTIFLPEEEKDEPEEMIEVPMPAVSEPSPITASAWQTSAPLMEVEDTHAEALALWEKGQEETAKATSKADSSEKEATSRMVDLVMSFEDQIGTREKEMAGVLERDAHFFLTPLNTVWFLSQKEKWQTANPEVKDVLESFYSPYSGALWGSDYLEELESLIKEHLTPDLVKNVLVPGCGEGQDAYVTACAIKKAFGNIRYKVWASDSDLSHIMNTQSLAFDVEATPGIYMDYMLNTSSGLQFDSEIKESILFEYSDVVKATPDKEVGLIVAYDLLSFLSAEDQVLVLRSFASQLDENGLLIVGCNEDVDSLQGSWVPVPSDKFKVYRKLN